MSARQIVGCDAAGCPVLENGRCLEGFEDPSECPHVELGQENGQPRPQLEDSTENGLEEDEQEVDDDVELGGGEALTLSQADRLAGQHGARIVLIAGEFQSGKTTLIAELYGRFLKGPYRGWSFAGSECLCAVDRRYHGTRESSGLAHPDVPRTEDEEMRLLDLRLRSDRRFLSLMMSDIRGEFFDNIVQGAAVESEVPIAPRADQLIILIDGEKVGEPFQRGLARSWTRQLIGGLLERGGVPHGLPTAIVLSKADLVDEKEMEWFREQADELCRYAAVCGCGQTEIFVTAARPDDSPHEPAGLAELFDWIQNELPEEPQLPSARFGENRSFWRLGTS